MCFELLYFWQNSNLCFSLLAKKQESVLCQSGCAVKVPLWTIAHNLIQLMWSADRTDPLAGQQSVMDI